MSIQDSLKRNRPARVQIDYKVEIGNATKLVELPFVMGVMADLTGNYVSPEIEQELAKDPVQQKAAVKKTRGDLSARQFQEINKETFDSSMRAMKPGVTFTVPNTLSGEGNLKVEMSFNSMDDFAPNAVAHKVPALHELLEARKALANLLVQLDGRTEAEDLIASVLSDPSRLQALAAAFAPEKKSEA